MGGVASFNYNIINFTTLKSIFYIKVILIKEFEDLRTPFIDTFFVDEVIYFNYSKKENKYFVQKRLNNLIDPKEGAIVTDNEITICAARRFNNPKTIFHLLHDFFYVKQHLQLELYIDNAVAHSSFFKDAIYSSNPEKWMNHIFYLPYGVQKQKIDLSCKKHNKLNLVFLGRLEKTKGVLSLIEIENKLVQQNVTVNWAIIGKGECKNELVKQWSHKKNCSFYEPTNTSEVFSILQNQDVFVFPTSFEGTPVSIIECLACGVVPIVNDLPGGIRDIVMAEIGFRLSLIHI
jgi:glycosyltransferase involved in cell wall biosynthesis